MLATSKFSGGFQFQAVTTFVESEMEDHQLLNEYARNQSEAAFAELFPVILIWCIPLHFDSSANRKPRAWRKRCSSGWPASPTQCATPARSQAGFMEPRGLPLPLRCVLNGDGANERATLCN